jgi:hypothetical protein
MVGSDEDRGKSRRFAAEDRAWSSTGQVLDDRPIERLCDAVCGLHHAQEDKERGFLSSTSKPRSTVSPGLTSKPLAQFSGLGLKTDSCGLVI